MMASRWLGVLGVAIGVAACREPAKADLHVGAEVAPLVDDAFLPIPAREGGVSARAALGRRLFADPRLSGDASVSCATCHVRDLAYTDGQRHAHPPTRDEGEVNVPTVLNLAYSYRYNWDGHFESLPEQVDAVMRKASAMRSSWDVVVPRIVADGELRAAFRAAYPTGVTAENARDALVAYLLSLTTPGARFDRWLLGDPGALDADEREGFQLFRSYGCGSCHQGRNVGGNLLQRFGIMDNYFEQRGAETEADKGLMRFTHDKADEYVFRVPSLRNVARTAPYFHDGTAKTLGDAVAVMGRYQLGRELTEHERTVLVAFLSTLTGDVDGAGP